MNKGIKVLIIVLSCFIIIGLIGFGMYEATNYLTNDVLSVDAVIKAEYKKTHVMYEDTEYNITLESSVYEDDNYFNEVYKMTVYHGSTGIEYHYRIIYKPNNFLYSIGIKNVKELKDIYLVTILNP